MELGLNAVETPQEVFKFLNLFMFKKKKKLLFYIDLPFIA